jgi:hypothetical protein
MALSEKQKQKKRQQRAQKRKKAGAARRPVSAAGSARVMAKSYARFPVHEVLCPGDLDDEGMGNLLLSRKGPDGLLGVSFFLVDKYCLGVKNAFFRELDEDQYFEAKQRTLYNRPAEPVAMHPACMRKLVESAVDYARDLGFAPHKDYGAAREIFGDIDASACPTRFDFGKEGKPLFIAGPNENLAKSRKIVKQLEKRCGAGGYDYIAWLGGEEMPGADNL